MFWASHSSPPCWSSPHKLDILTDNLLNHSIESLDFRGDFVGQQKQTARVTFTAASGSLMAPITQSSIYDQRAAGKTKLVAKVDYFPVILEWFKATIWIHWYFPPVILKFQIIFAKLGSIEYDPSDGLFTRRAASSAGATSFIPSAGVFFWFPLHFLFSLPGVEMKGRIPFLEPLTVLDIDKEEYKNRVKYSKWSWHCYFELIKRERKKISETQNLHFKKLKQRRKQN